MKSTVEQLSPTRVRINVEVPFDELKPNFDRAYAKLAGQVRIPGFRPGKAPARVLESRIGRAPVLEEVVNEAIPVKYMEAVSSGDVKTLGQPEIEVTKVEDGDELAFTAEVDVRPEIEVPAFGELSVSVDEIEVTEEQVQTRLDELRARFGTLTGVDRPIAADDFVVIDLSATVNGEELTEAATTGLSYQVGSGELVEGIDDALIGAGAEETKTFTTKLVAGDHAGEDAEVTVHVQSVKERELPAADDEFAQLASEFDTLDELVAKEREQLAEMNKMQQAVQARDKVLEALLEVTEVPLPESIVAAEVDARRHDALHAVDHDEDRLAAVLEQQGSSKEEFDTNARTDAEKAVKTQLVLDAIAEAQQLQVGEGELIERIMYQAQRFDVTPEEYLRRAQQSGQLNAIFADIRRGKALASVVRDATVTDSAGNTVDLSEMFAEQSGDAESATDDAAADSAATESTESTDAPEATESTEAAKA